MRVNLSVYTSTILAVLHCVLGIGSTEFLPHLSATKSCWNRATRDQQKDNNTYFILHLKNDVYINPNELYTRHDVWYLIIGSTTLSTIYMIIIYSRNQYQYGQVSIVTRKVSCHPGISIANRSNRAIFLSRKNGIFDYIRISIIETLQTL